MFGISRDRQLPKANGRLSQKKRSHSNDLKNSRRDGRPDRIVDRCASSEMGGNFRFSGFPFPFVIQLQFSSKNEHVRRRFDPDANLVPSTTYQSHGYGITDSNPLAFST